MIAQKIMIKIGMKLELMVNYLKDVHITAVSSLEAKCTFTVVTIYVRDQ
jgi:hypothetical protein